MTTKIKLGRAEVVNVFMVSDSDPLAPATTPAGNRSFLDLKDKSGVTDLTVNADMVLEHVEAADAGDGYLVTLTAAAALAITAEDASGITITFDDGVTTGNELADFIDANASFLKVAYRGSLGAALVNTDDEFSAQALGGGVSNYGEFTLVLVKWIGCGRPLLTIGSEVMSPITSVLNGEPGVARGMLRQSGIYQVYLDAADVGPVGEGILWLRGSVISAEDARKPIQVVGYDPEADGVNVIEWDGTAVATPNTAGVPKVDVSLWRGTAPNALSFGRVDSNVGAMAANVVTASAIASNAITSAKVAANAIGASQLASDAAAEIADAVWDEDLSGHATAGSAGAALSGATAPTAAAVADAVWDEARAGHTTAGTFGEGVVVSSIADAAITAAAIAADALTAAKVAADVGTEIAAAVWATALEGSHTAGDLMRGTVSALVGTVSSFITGTLLFKSLNAAKTRWTVVTDETGRIGLTVGDLT